MIIKTNVWIQLASFKQADLRRTVIFARKIALVNVGVGKR